MFKKKITFIHLNVSQTQPSVRQAINVRPLGMDSSQAAHLAHQSSRQISTLSTGHRAILVRAVENICNTDAARMTYAQILDGVPIVPLLDGGNPGYTLPMSHPSRKEHQQLCPGVLERLDKFRADFNIEALPLDAKACFLSSFLVTIAPHT